MWFHHWLDQSLKRWGMLSQSNMWHYFRERKAVGRSHYFSDSRISGSHKLIKCWLTFSKIVNLLNCGTWQFINKQNVNLEWTHFKMYLLPWNVSITLGCSAESQSSGIWGTIQGVLFLEQEDPWRREWQPAPVFLPGEFHGQTRELQRYRHDWATNTLSSHSRSI